MIKFLIKKSFFDAWDNLLSLIILNLGFIICIAAAVFPPLTIRTNSTISIILLALPGILILNGYAGIISYLLYDISNFNTIKLSGIKKGLEKTWKASIIFSVINIVILTVISISFTFYMSMNSIMSIAGAGFIFWGALLWFISCQFFYPFLIRMNGSIISTIKKSLLFALDNPLFSIFIFIISAVLLVISVITALLIPGISAILLLHQDTVKLRLYKYDWLEKNNDAARKKIPWNELLKDDNEIIGHRSLKGMIFPWKD